MIVVDSSTWIAFLRGDGDEDLELLLATGRRVTSEGTGEAPQSAPGRRPDRQSGIDRGIPLLTRDGDFRAFADAAGLDLLIGFAAAEPISSNGR